MRIRGLPCWTGPITVQLLRGGLSNQNFLVTDPSGGHVVRFGIDYPFHHVSRERELMSARAAHACGFAPRVEYAQPGVTVTTYLGAKTFDAADVRANCSRVAQLLREFHTEMPKQVTGAGYIFWVFHVVRDYARALIEGKSRLAGEVPSYLELAAELEDAQYPMPIVFGHHDLLPANFLDDGKRLWLIDFEYAGFGTAMFDLANVASNAGMSADETREFLDAYFAYPADDTLLRAHAAMQCASLLREVMWALVSELHLDTPGVDYAAYADDNIARLRVALATYQKNYGKTSS
ncbi:MAG TPA: choline/ethanolamine kinase family protein [Mesorhizobium sp.]